MQPIDFILQKLNAHGYEVLLPSCGLNWESQTVHIILANLDCIQSGDSFHDGGLVSRLLSAGLHTDLIDSSGSINY